MSTDNSTIFYTITDEAPFLATQSFLPILNAFAAKAGIDVETRDISLAARILAQFSDRLPDEQKVNDALTELGEIAKTEHANIIKLPNISASIPQLKKAIAELQDQGFSVPNYPEDASTAEQKEVVAKYAKVLGSAVNPVLREGNSDRRVAKAVKDYAKANPHSMGEWTSQSKSHVASMNDGDFYSTEKSYVCQEPITVNIVLHKTSGETETLKENLQLQESELIDAAVMSAEKLKIYYAQEIQDAKAKDILLSLHLKATMMKVSDPILFGHCIEVYFKDVFSKHHDSFKKLGVSARLGLGDLYFRLKELPDSERKVIEDDLAQALKNGPRLAMVDSDNGITNLHVPSDVIIDASMPAAIRNSGRMWAADGKAYDTKALIPDRSYAGVYQATIDFCKQHGAFDVKSMGSVSNVGLMAKKAEEYGSHDKTFEISEKGEVKVTSANGEQIFSHSVSEGDIWRMCQTKDVAIRDWVKLAVHRAQQTGNSAIFWLDNKRAHDAKLIEKVKTYLKDHDTSKLYIQILAPVEACQLTCEKIKNGEDVISVTGNVLRDYLTDLFPILELGTSAKMLSIVPLLAGGGLFETGAGGSAPKHVQQFLEENHLRWDSLGEFLALGVSLEHEAEKNKNKKAQVLADALEKANSRYLLENKSPSRTVNELDNRGSHFYLCLYWAQALAEQNDDTELKKSFATLAEKLFANKEKIVSELNEVQGQAVDIKGYFHPNREVLTKAMRPSPTFNQALTNF